MNPDNPRGSGKARVFAAILGITTTDAEDLRKILLEVAQTGDAKLGELDMYGQRYTMDFEMETAKGKAMVRSGWIILHKESVPRLTTCYLLKRKRK